MKKTAYALCGAAMIVIAVLARTFADGGAELLTLPADGYATEDVGQRMRRLMQAALAKNRKATLFNKNATVSAIDGLSLPAAKHLAADLAALTGVSLPLTDRAAIDAPGFAA